MNALAYLARRF